MAIFVLVILILGRNQKKSEINFPQTGQKQVKTGLPVCLLPTVTEERRHRRIHRAPGRQRPGRLGEVVAAGGVGVEGW